MIPTAPNGPASEPPPTPLQSKPAAIPFPTDAFPPIVANMIAGVAEQTQTDPAMAGSVALAVLAAAVCGHVEIEGSTGWVEPLTLFTATIAEPGERKSSVHNAMRRPLDEAEKALIAASVDERATLEMMRDIAEKRFAQAKKQAAEGSTPEKRQQGKNDALEAQAELAEIVVPGVPRLTADEATNEAVASLMAENRGRIAVMSTEGGVFDMLGGRYSNGSPNLGIYLAGHAGDSFKVDRKGRDPEVIDKAVMTVGVMVQPRVIEELASNPVFLGKGLVARFLYAWPESKLGRRKIRPTPVPVAVAAMYANQVVSLVSGARSGEGTHLLALDGEADEYLRQYEAEIEPLLAKTGRLGGMFGWGSKLVGAVLRIAGLLHLAEHGPAGLGLQVSRTNLEQAARLGDYFATEALRVFAEVDTDEVTKDAEYLLDKLREQTDREDMSKAEMKRVCRRFKKSTDLDGPLQLLVDNGWLFRLPDPEQRGGQKPSPRFRFHQRIHADVVRNLFEAEEEAAS